MVRSSLRSVAAVVVVGAALVAGDAGAEVAVPEVPTTVSCPQPPPCTCETEVSKAVAGERERYDSLSSKLKECETGKSTELSTCNSRLGELQPKLNVMQTEYTSLKTAFDEAKASYEKRVSDLSAEARALMESASTLKHANAELRSRAQQEVETVKSEAIRQLKTLQSQKDELEAQVARFTSTVYSSSQFWTSISHLKRIGKAFTGFIQKRLEEVLNVDIMTVGKLQLSVWKARVSERAKPYMTTLSSVHRQYTEPHVTMVRNTVKSTVSKPLTTAKETVSTQAEKAMARVIRNLKSVDPEIESLFPETFHDRCYAFAFIICAAYGAMSIAQFALNVVVSTIFPSKKPTPNATRKVAKPAAKPTSDKDERKGTKSGKNAERGAGAGAPAAGEEEPFSKLIKSNKRTVTTTETQGRMKGVREPEGRV